VSVAGGADVRAAVGRVGSRRPRARGPRASGRPGRRWVVVGALAVVALAACGSDTPVAADGACRATARYPTAIGCAYVYGSVRDAGGAALDSFDGLVRVGDACSCSSPRIESDDNGVYSTIVHRLPRAGGFADTASATVVALASAPKYPRHVTGAAYFDTSRVLLRFVPLGAVPPPVEVNLRIVIPGR